VLVAISALEKPAPAATVVETVRRRLLEIV
jgi:hypothetical protein